jgi:undecaprenyl-diphosphatase
MLTVIDDIPKEVLAGIVAAVAVARLWAALDRRSAPGHMLRRAWSRQSVRRATASLLAAVALVAIAEDVLFVEEEELILRLDRRVRAALVETPPTLRQAAAVASRVTGEGLAVATVAAVLVLVIARWLEEAVVVTLGALSAWALSGALKILFLVPRPRADVPMRLAVSYGFPSGHTLVALVVCGLLAWAVGRHVHRGLRLSLLAAAWMLALTAGAARVVLEAHWPSDVGAGLAIGWLWLNGLLALADSRLGPASRRCCPS